MIHWNADPELIHLGFITIRWYGLLFSLSFLTGYAVLAETFRDEGVSEIHLDRLLMVLGIGTIAGARLGHCLFYEPEIYLADPIRILKVWEGGLASHGAAVGIFTALAYYSRRYHLGYLWLCDRVCMGVALAGGWIRLGNLFNSEIVGRPTNVPWAFVFERVDLLPRHPAQLYESLSYFAIFGILYRVFWNTQLRRKSGAMVGLMLCLTFTVRFFLEFVKENQVSFESHLPLDMGQLLSIPLVLGGLVLLLRPRKVLDVTSKASEDLDSADLEPKPDNSRKKSRASRKQKT